MTLDGAQARIAELERIATGAKAFAETVERQLQDARSEVAQLRGKLDWISSACIVHTFDEKRRYSPVDQTSLSDWIGRAQKGRR